MIKNKLIALNYPSPSGINVDDPKQFRCTILWLEDQKIRQYKIEDRVELRKVDSPQEWNAAYELYKEHVGSPGTLKSPTEEILWLLNHAIRLEYFDHAEKYKSYTAEQMISEKAPIAPSIKSTNPFDNYDFSSQDFENGVRNLAKKLGIAYHPDHLETLKAVSKVVKNHLGTEALKEQIPEGAPFPYLDGAGFNLNDADVETAARILRLLQISSFRKLQTNINETIVAVQNLTANPKTDTKLGKVGY